MNKLSLYVLSTLIASGVVAKSQEVDKERKVSLDGWFEASIGTPDKNLRLYPELNMGSVKINSLIDFNKYFQFSKTDISTEKAQIDVGSFNVKPVLTVFQDQYNGFRAMAGANVSYFVPDKLFGFAELSMNPLKFKEDSRLYTYNGVFLPNDLGSVGLFTSTPINNIKQTYVELEATGPAYKGFAPYGRFNFQNGEKPTWQIGVSVKPKKMFNRHR